MPKYYTPSGIVCPNFRDCTHTMLRCDGHKDGIVQHIAFANRTEYVNHRKAYCMGDWESCPYRQAKKE